MERSSATVTRRPSTAQPSSASTTTRTKLKPSASTLRGSNGATRPITASSKSPVAPSPTPTATSSIRRGLKSQDGTTPTASASRRTSTSSASIRSAASPVPTQSSTLSRRSTTATPTSTSTLGRTAPTSTLSRRASSASTTTSTTSTTRRKSTLSSSTNGSSPGTPTPSISRRIGATPTASSSVTSSSRTSSSSTAARSPASQPTTIDEEDDDPLSLIQAEIDTLTDQLKAMEQQMSDNQDRILTSQTEIDELHKVLDDAQSQQEERLLESVVDMTEQLKEQETTRDEALARLAEWQAQAQAQAEMVRQLEEMEVAYRDEMETLRDTLQNENDQLESSLNDMAKKVDELEESSGALREEIQGMHKSHQARMTTLSNQLHQEHSEEWNALTQTLDKELEEKENSSEWADVANKRKEMVDLERSIQALEEKRAGMDQEFTRHQAELKMDLTSKLEAITASHENEITHASKHHKNQMAELETEHSDQITSIKSQYQSDIDASSSLANLGDNDDLKKMALDIQANLEAEHEQKLEATRQEQKSRLDLVQSQLDDMVNQLESLKAATSQEHDLKKQFLEQQLNDERALMITQLETDFAAKLDALVKSHQTALDDHRIQLEQDHLPRIESLKNEHNQIHSALVDEHDRKVLELQASTAAGVRASTERQVRAEFETDIATLTRNHQQALEDLQSDHRVASKAFEESLEKAKQAHQTTKGTSTSQHQDQNEATAMEKSENDNIELIRAQIQASLNQVHAATIAKHVAEHESRLGEMKRDHILQKDRTLEKMTKEFDSQVNDIKSQNDETIHSTQQEHDTYINGLLAASKNTLIEKQVELTNQHEAVKDQLRQTHSSQIESASEELDRHTSQRKALDQIQTQLMDEVAAFKISSTKELQDRKTTMDDNAMKASAHLEAAHHAKLDDIKAKHQETLDTLLAEYQHDIESQSQHISPQPDMEDALADSYKEQIDRFILEQESKAAALSDTLNRLMEQNKALENEQQSQLHALQQEWTTRLEDATRSAEQLSETTLLNEPIRTHMHGEAKKSHDELVAAHSRSLESLVASHTLALDQLAKDHDTEMAELDLKLQPMLEEQTHWMEHIKKLEQDHDTQIKTMTETHDNSVAAHTEETSAKQADLERYQTELDQVRKQLLGVQADLQLKAERRDELQKQLGDAPPPVSMNNQPSSSTFDQDILAKQNTLRALELEIQQLEDKHRRQIEEQNSADHAVIKQNEKTVHDLVIQHQQEIEKMHRHLQHLLDVKDDEINNVSYRLKTVTSSRQKDINNLQTKQRGKVHSLEEQQKQVKDALATRTAAYDRLATQQQALKVNFDQGAQNVAALTREKQEMQSTVATYKAENTHLLQTIHQLQSKMHKIQLG
ncbi:hypothetical protein [Absidia glauca]|uniref:Uncharacterized protein n=1 Tax=Absidia glauca TaxID=4829 RepID=A0A163JKN8_ABSGL|nr:hypothetical protein [Absidia glauca]